LRHFHSPDANDDGIHHDDGSHDFCRYIAHLPLLATGNRIECEMEVSQRWALRQHSRKPCIAEATLLPLECKASRSAGEVAATCLTAWQLECADVAVNAVS
jgi:hypothetical protein